MATRTVRLDAEAEQVLAALTRATGQSISEVLKRGLLAYRDQTRQGVERRPWEVFRQLDLGTGGDARGAASGAKRLVRGTIARKHGR